MVILNVDVGDVEFLRVLDCERALKLTEGVAGYTQFDITRFRRGGAEPGSRGGKRGCRGPKKRAARGRKHRLTVYKNCKWRGRSPWRRLRWSIALERKGREPAAPYRPGSRDPAERVAVRFARVPKERKGREPAAPYRPGSRDPAGRVAVRFARVPKESGH